MLDNEQYLQLCTICDSILNRKKRLHRISIPWLNILKWHPSLLQDYAVYFNKKSIGFHLTLIFKKFLTYLLGWIVNLYCSCFSKYKIFHYLSKPNIEYDVLLVSHFLGQESLSVDQDHYFGTLHQDLKLNGIKVLRVLINQTNISDVSELMGQREISDSLILPKTKNLLSQFSLLLKFINEFLLLLRDSIFLSGDRVERLITLRSAVEALSGRSREAMVIAHSIYHTIVRHKIPTVLFTFEGHSWERALVNIVKENTNKVKLIGYQFVGVTEAYHSIKRSFGCKYNPDLIMCTGALAIERLKERGFYDDVHFDILGTFRLPSLTNTHEHFDNKKNLKKSICLVLPEGIDDQVSDLVGFAKKIAIKMPMIEFIIRLHPITLPKNLDKNGCLRNLPSNIRLSNKDLNSDALSAKWAIYKGSTSILNCFALGVAPLYINEEHTISLDVLLQDDSSPYLIRNQNDLFVVISNWKYDDIFNGWVNKTTKNLKSMYEPFNSQKMLKILEAF